MRKLFLGAALLVSLVTGVISSGVVNPAPTPAPMPPPTYPLQHTPPACGGPGEYACFPTPCVTLCPKTGTQRMAYTVPNTCPQQSVREGWYASSNTRTGDQSIEAWARAQEKGFYTSSGSFVGCGVFQAEGVYRSVPQSQEYAVSIDSFIWDDSTSQMVPGSEGSWSGFTPTYQSGHAYYYFWAPFVNLDCSTHVFHSVFSVTESNQNGDGDFSYSGGAYFTPPCV